MRRTEFNDQTQVVLDFMETYRVLKPAQLEKFFPDAEKIVGYLVRHERLFRTADKIYISADDDPRPDKTLLAALGVLGDIFEKVQKHSKGVPPVQISFLTYNNEYYEIIYVSHGMEAMVTASFEAQLAAKMRDKKNIYTTKRMVIVEDAGQMDRLDIPGTMRYALVQPNGSLTYHKAGS